MGTDKKYEIEHMYIDFRSWSLSEKLRKLRDEKEENKSQVSFYFDEYYLSSLIDSLNDL
jgi:hypothetical protein